MKNKVKEYRVEQNLTQEELAKKANVSRYLISRIEMAMMLTLLRIQCLVSLKL